MKVTVTVDFDSGKKKIVMKGTNADYRITEDLLVVTSDKHDELLIHL